MNNRTAAVRDVASIQADTRRPLISVILPTYNRARQLMDSVDSVLKQSYKNLELIVVDDGSEDESVSVIRTIADSRLKLIVLPQNKGANAARNTGIRASMGEYVCFQDSDDLWHVHKLHVQIEDMQRSKAKVGFCAFERFDHDRRQAIPKKGYRIPTGKNDLSKHVLKGSFIGCPTLLIERTLLLELGGFDENLRRLQDWELSIRLCFAAKAVYTPRILVTAKPGEDSLSRNTQDLIPSANYIFQKHAVKFRCDAVASGILFLGLGLVALKDLKISCGSRLFYQSLMVSKMSFPIVLGILLYRRFV